MSTITNQVDKTQVSHNQKAKLSLPRELMIVVCGYLPFSEVNRVLNATETKFYKYDVYRTVIGQKTALSGSDLEEYRQVFSMEWQALHNGEEFDIKSWSVLLKEQNMYLDVKHLDLSDTRRMSNKDLLAITEFCPHLTTLILPCKFPNDEVMAKLRENCPQAAIYPSAMTEEEWANPQAFMQKLPPYPQKLQDFLESQCPYSIGNVPAKETHFVVPVVQNFILKGESNRLTIWFRNLAPISIIDQDTDGPGINYDLVQLDRTSQYFGPPTSGFEWAVMTKKPIETQGHSYLDHKNFVENLGYKVPRINDAATCILWEHRRSGNRLYRDDEFTICEESIINRNDPADATHAHLVIGGFQDDNSDEPGLNISNTELIDQNLNSGIAGMLKFAAK